MPKLAGGPLHDYPRIYAVALALTAHTDSRLDTNTLRRFIASYQTVSPLSIGELWAVAITLRLALVENLRRLAVSVIRGREDTIKLVLTGLVQWALSYSGLLVTAGLFGPRILGALRAAQSLLLPNPYPLRG